MEAKAQARFIRQTPRKIGLALDQIRGKDALKAMTTLRFFLRRSANPVLKTLQSAVANLSVKIGHKIEPQNIKVTQCIANSGPVLKRIHPGSMGRAMPYKKKMSHITIQVEAVEIQNGTKNKP